MKTALKFILFAVLGYALHILIEAFVVTNLLASIGYKIPIILV